ncbi:MAG: hypothetical protein LBE12_17900 [Planctomycetaceae bacterium]|nr:hypothetical protein [Planctomycetaceae bacterium]
MSQADYYQTAIIPLATLSTINSQLSTLNYSHPPSGVKSEKQKFHGYITNKFILSYFLRFKKTVTFIIILLPLRVRQRR